MPLPPAITAPFDTVAMALNFARVRSNDAAQSLAGNLLASTQPYLYTIVNSAWRKLQMRLMNNGVENFPNEIVMYNFPAVASVNPATQVYIDYAGSFDGQNLWPPGTYPALPQDMYNPVWVQERQAGASAGFCKMWPRPNGLPTRMQYQSLVDWEWRNSTLYFVGATIPRDIRLRYNRFYTDLAQVTGDLTPMPVMRCGSAMGWYIAAEFSNPRGGEQAADLEAHGDMETDQLENATARRLQQSAYQRRGYGGGWAARRGGRSY